MNVHVAEAWSPENCFALAKARRQRLFIAGNQRPVLIPPKVVPARIRLAADLYFMPIGPRWHTHMYDAPIGPVLPTGYAARTRPVIPTSFEDMQVLEIIDYMCDLRKMSKAVILGPQRHASIIKVRHEMMHLLRSVGKWSLPEIGRRMADRDHTTILHGHRKFEKLIASGMAEPTPFIPELAVWACRKRITVAQ